MGKTKIKLNPERQRVRFNKEFKLEAVRLLELGHNPATQLALELGVARNQLYTWQDQLRKTGSEATFRGPGRMPLDQQCEIERLKHELKKVTEERDILKKATVGSTGRCNTIYPNLDLEGGEYGSNGETRAFRIPESGTVATMEIRSVFERHRSCAQQACRVGARRRVIEWRHRSCNASAFSLGAQTD
jgi:transposase